MAFVIDVTYAAPLEEIERHLAAHLSVLTHHAELGTVVAFGKKESRTGGVIVTADVDRPTVDRMLGEDPFLRLGLARYTVTEVMSSRAARQS